MEEIWKESPLLPDYDASSFGRVRRKTYSAKMPHGGSRIYGGKAHYGQLSAGSGQPRRIFVYRGKSYKVHRVVCAAFHGMPEDGQICEHLDEDADNNKPDNLMWSTQKANLNRPKVKAYHRSRTGENNPHVKGIKARLLASHDTEG